MAATLPINFVWTRKDYEVLLIVTGLVSYTQFGFTIKIKPTVWREFLGGRGIGRRKAPS
jgi:hypothetical protein